MRNFKILLILPVTVMLFCGSLIINITACSTTVEQQPVQVICQNPFFFEDFSTTNEGMIPKYWIGGYAVGVTRNIRGKSLYTTILANKSQQIEQSFIIKDIDFPSDYEFIIDANHFGGCPNPFIINLGNMNFAIGRYDGHDVLKNKKYHYFYGWLDNVKFKVEGKGRGNQFRVVVSKVGPVFKLRLNDEHLATTRMANYTNPGVIHFFVHDFHKFFKINNIVLCGINGTTHSKSNSENRQYFINEDFADTEEGLIPSNWIDGSNFMVKSSERYSGKKVLVKIERKNSYFTIPNLNFPDNFMLEFELSLPLNTPTSFSGKFSIGKLDFNLRSLGERSSQQLISTVRFGSTHDFMWESYNRVVLPSDTFLLQLKREGPIFTLYFNGYKMAMKRINDFDNPTTLSYSAEIFSTLKIYKISGYTVK